MVQPPGVKLDPGAPTCGSALLDGQSGEVARIAGLTHRREAIQEALAKRQSPVGIRSQALIQLAIQAMPGPTMATKSTCVCWKSGSGDGPVASSPRRNCQSHISSRRAGEAQTAFPSGSFNITTARELAARWLSVPAEKGGGVSSHPLNRVGLYADFSMKSLTGQYECAHRSGLGLDYFTARIDHLTLYANGRFSLVTQEKSRLSHAAKSLASGQQASMNAPEIRVEGSYSARGSLLILDFDNGEQEQAQIQDAGLQMGQRFFEKVADSTLMPAPRRVKSNMEDIAKGLKIAGTIGSTMFKAAKTIQDALQSPAQGQQGTPDAHSAGQAPPAAPSAGQATPAPVDDETLYCDQCGQPVRSGKKFCHHCGARLP
jgi:hypothetical protein